jgi:DNA modification methylase
MRAEILVGDCREVLRTLPPDSVQCVVTSPPYFGLRDYGHPDQIGLEQTPAEYVAKLVDVFRQVRRVLRPDGVLWLNLGDSYAAQGGAPIDGTLQRPGSQVGAWGGDTRRPPAGFKPKDLLGIPWRTALALQEDGWWLRRDIIWDKPNAMPESVTDRPSSSHEYVFLLTKSATYFYDAAAIREPHSESSLARVTRNWSGNRARDYPGTPQTMRMGEDQQMCHPNGRNKRSVWRVNTASYKGAHYATFPPKLVAPMILAGCPEGGTVLDPFGGSGTVGEVATRLGRRSILIELNPEYAAQAERRNLQHGLEF